MNIKKPIVLSISAVSGGGKTTIIEKLKEILPNSISLHFDEYDFDCPKEIIDWVQRGADYSEYILTPLIDDIKEILSSEKTTEWILLDYPFSYVKDDIGKYIDVSIFLDTPLDVAMSRRLLRDHENSLSKDILDDIRCYMNYARVCYLEMLKTVKPTCDLIIDGNQVQDKIVHEILDYLDKHMLE